MSRKEFEKYEIFTRDQCQSEEYYNKEKSEITVLET